MVLRETKFVAADIAFPLLHLDYTVLPERFFASSFPRVLFDVNPLRLGCPGDHPPTLAGRLGALTAILHVPLSLGPVLAARRFFGEGVALADESLAAVVEALAILVNLSPLYAADRIAPCETDPR